MSVRRPPAGHVARDGGGVLPLPVLLLPHVAPEPEGHVRPPAVPAGELQHPAVTAVAARQHPAGRQLLVPDGQHRAGAGAQVSPAVTVTVSVTVSVTLSVSICQCQSVSVRVGVPVLVCQCQYQCQFVSVNVSVCQERVGFQRVSVCQRQCH